MKRNEDKETDPFRREMGSSRQKTQKFSKRRELDRVGPSDFLKRPRKGWLRRGKEREVKVAVGSRKTSRLGMRSREKGLTVEHL